MDAGDTFLIDNRATDDHLWVIISDPRTDDQRVVIVNLTTYRPPKERFCLIQAGEHPFVRHETCVAYNHARIVSLSRLTRLRYGGRINMQDPVSIPLLARIRLGVGLSALMPLDCVAIMAGQRLT